MPPLSTPPTTDPVRGLDSPFARGVVSSYASVRERYYSGRIESESVSGPVSWEQQARTEVELLRSIAAALPTEFRCARRIEFQELQAAIGSAAGAILAAGSDSARVRTEAIAAISGTILRGEPVTFIAGARDSGAERSEGATSAAFGSTPPTAVFDDATAVAPAHGRENLERATDRINTAAFGLKRRLADLGRDYEAGKEPPELVRMSQAVRVLQRAMGRIDSARVTTLGVGDITGIAIEAVSQIALEEADDSPRWDALVDAVLRKL